MALIFMDGFDAGDIATKWNFAYAGGIATPGTSTTTRFSVGRSLTTPSSNGGGYSGLRKLIPASATVYVGCAFMCNNLSAGRSILILGGDGGATSHLSVSFDQTTGALQLYRGDYATLLATSASSLILAGAWNYIELSATIADTGGACEVRCNGATVMSYSGDTRNAGTSTNIDAITLQSSIVGSGSLVCQWDDMYVCDATGAAPYNTFLGDVRIATLSPNGVGSSTGFTPSAGSNYQTVDELPYSAADYVSATASGTRDTYAMSDISGSYSVLAVQNNVIAKKTDAGGTALKPAIKSGASVYYGSSKVLTSNDATISDIRTTDPATSAAWTVTAVNSLEAGMEIA